MRWNAKTDRNQAEIVAALRAAGASVRTIHRIGSGLPDLLVGYRGRNYLLEIKSPAGTLTPDETEFFQSWRGQVAIVRTPTEALAAIGAIDHAPEPR